MNLAVRANTTCPQHALSRVVWCHFVGQSGKYSSAIFGRRTLNIPRATLDNRSRLKEICGRPADARTSCRISVLGFLSIHTGPRVDGLSCGDPVPCCEYGGLNAASYSCGQERWRLRQSSLNAFLNF